MLGSENNEAPRRSRRPVKKNLLLMKKVEEVET